MLCNYKKKTKSGNGISKAILLKFLIHVVNIKISALIPDKTLENYHRNAYMDVYIPVACPSSLIISGITFLMCEIYFLHFSAVIFSFQNWWIPWMSSSFVCGLSSFRSHSLSSCQTISVKEIALYQTHLSNIYSCTCISYRNIWKYTNRLFWDVHDIF